MRRMKLNKNRKEEECTPFYHGIKHRHERGREFTPQQETFIEKEALIIRRKKSTLPAAYRELITTIVRDRYLAKREREIRQGIQDRTHVCRSVKESGNYVVCNDCQLVFGSVEEWKEYIDDKESEDE